MRVAYSLMNLSSYLNRSSSNTNSAGTRAGVALFNLSICLLLRFLFLKFFRAVLEDGAAAFALAGFPVPHGDLRSRCAQYRFIISSKQALHNPSVAPLA